MESSVVNNLMSNYKYLGVIRCKINKEYYNTNYIPSFITNKTVGYLLKDDTDIHDIIKEIFLVWRYKYHSSSDPSIRESNIMYMKQSMHKLSDLKYVPYIDFKIDSGIEPFANIDCCFRVYPMREEFIHLFDLVYEANKTEFNNRLDIAHKVIPYIIYKDPNPNRLQIHITCADYITKSINQTFLFSRQIYDLDFYEIQFERLGLAIKNKTRFIELLNSRSSFLLTKDDFESKYEIVYSNVYFLSPIDERVTSVKQDVYYLKMNLVIKSMEELSKPKIINTKIGYIIKSFL